MRPAPSTRPASVRRAIRGRVGLIVSLCCLAWAPTVPGGEPPPSDALLRLVPADSTLVVTVDRLREHSRALLGSRLARDVRELPAFKAWLDTGKVRDFLESRGRIEEFLGAKLGEIRDEVFGDAVVLALRLPSKSVDPAEARGLLVLKARDPKLLGRLVGLVNETQRRNGEIAELSEHDRGAAVCHTRTFPEGGDHLPESFAIFADGTFAFSNDERLIHEVVDRKTAAADAAGTGSIADHRGFRATSARLPSRAVARLFVEPKTARRLLGGGPARPSAGDHGAAAMLDRYVDGLDYLGAGLVVDDREIRVQAVQAFEPEKFRELTGVLVDDPSADRPGTRLFVVPTTAAALVSLGVDFPMLYRTIVSLVSAPDRPRIAKLEALATGLSLGLDFRRQVLPALGPRAVAYLEPPDLAAVGPESGRGGRPGGFPFPFVVAAEIDEGAVSDSRSGDSPAVAAAVDNALSTVLTALSLDEKRVPPDTRVEARDVDGVAVKSLSARSPLAYAVDQPGRRLIVGSSPDAVARYIEAGADPGAGARFESIRAAAFPDCDSYACLDLAAVRNFAARNRDRIVEATAGKQSRPAEDVARDLDQVLGLVQLFDAAYFSTRVDVDGAALEHSIGLLPRR